MASMRVHELAKEFGLSSKDMLDRIHEMKIPAKSHASVLADAYVAKIRKKMGPVATTVVTENDEERTRIVTKDKVEELNRHAEEERARREAVEKERARREEERARATPPAPTPRPLRTREALALRMPPSSRPRPSRLSKALRTR